MSSSVSFCPLRVVTLTSVSVPGLSLASLTSGSNPASLTACFTSLSFNSKNWSWHEAYTKSVSLPSCAIRLISRLCRNTMTSWARVPLPKATACAASSRPGVHAKTVEGSSSRNRHVLRARRAKLDSSITTSTTTHRWAVRPGGLQDALQSFHCQHPLRRCFDGHQSRVTPVT